MKKTTLIVILAAMLLFAISAPAAVQAEDVNNVLYSKAEWQRIQTTNEVEVFSVTLPANFFASNMLKYRIRFQVDQSTTASRTLILRFKLNGNLYGVKYLTKTANHTAYYWLDGDVTRYMPNQQWAEFVLLAHNIDGGTLSATPGHGLSPTEWDANPMEATFTMQVNNYSSFDVYHFGVVVEVVPNTE